MSEIDLGRYRPYPEYKNSGVEWIGEIPEHWEIRPLFSLMQEKKDRNRGNYETNVLSLSYGRIIRRDVSSNLGLMPESFETYQIVNPGDLILRLTDLQNDKRSLRVGYVRERGIITSAYLCLRSGHELDSDYVYELLNSYDLQKVFYGLGGGVRQTMKFEHLKWMPLLLPPLPEQRAIAAFLDRETARIDELIAHKQRLIELLQEKRSALITQAVTQGLDPDVEMKDSGVEWLGEVPKHWEVSKNRALFEVIDNRSTTGEEELLTVSHITGVTRRSEKNVNMIEALSHEGYKICERGDLVINTMWAWMGALGIAWENGIVSPSYNVYRPREGWLFPEYFDFFCRIPAYVCDIIRHSKGVWKSRLRLYPDEFMDIISLVPPMEEQVAIVGVLEREFAQTSELESQIQLAINHLNEYRTALISAAVTGKIDVRDPSPTLPWQGRGTTVGRGWG